VRSSKSSSTASTTSGLDAADAIVIELATILVHVVVYLAADEIVGAAASATVESMNSPAERGCRTASLTGDRTDGSAPVDIAGSVHFVREGDSLAYQPRGRNVHARSKGAMDRRLFLSLVAGCGTWPSIAPVRPSRCVGCG
jgi:hypothetical protein